MIPTRLQELIMSIESQHKTERLAKISRVLGGISFLLILFPLGLFLWARAISPPSDDFSLLGWAVLAVFMMLGSLLLGIPGCVLALVALNRNKVEGEDPAIKKIANTGLLFSVLGIIGALVIIVFGWIGASSMPGPVPTPIAPKPTTSVP
jgi:hypothetical protein